MRLIEREREREERNLEIDFAVVNERIFSENLWEDTRCVFNCIPLEEF